MSHADIKSQHKSDILKSKQSIKDKQDALKKSQVSIKELNNNLDQDAVRVTDSLQQLPQNANNTLANNALDPMTKDTALDGIKTQVMNIDPKMA
jgi:flagellin-specific chaperone FliS